MRLRQTEAGDATSATALPTAVAAAATSDARWERIARLVDGTSPDTAATPSNLPYSPPTTSLDLIDLAMYGVTPLETGGPGRALFKCKDCSRPVLENALEAHQVNCQAIRDRKSSKHSSSAVDGSASGKKRRLSDGSLDSIINSSPKKTKTAAAFALDKSSNPPLSHSQSLPNLDSNGNPKKIMFTLGKSSIDRDKLLSSSGGSKSSSKAREPVNIDRQCGVINEKGLHCSRSLTCKTHSMGAKRSVPHRSQAYDILLQDALRVAHPERTIAARAANKARLSSGATGAELTGVGGAALSGEGPAAGGGGGVHVSARVSSDGKKRRGGSSGGGSGSLGDGAERTKKGSMGYAAGSGSNHGGGGGGISASAAAAAMRFGEAEESDNDDDGEGAGADGTIDSDEEVEGVLKGLNNVFARGGRPLKLARSGFGGWNAGRTSFFVDRNIKLGRLREVLGGVFGGASLLAKGKS